MRRFLPIVLFSLAATAPVQAYEPIWQPSLFDEAWGMAPPPQPVPAAEAVSLPAGANAPVADPAVRPASWLDHISVGAMQPAASAAPPPVVYPNIKLGGAFQADVGFFSQDAGSVAEYGHIQNGGDFRRARLHAGGAVTETVNYFFQMDFAFFGRPTFTDVWVEQTGLPLLGNLKVGQWKQPFSLEVVSSYRYTTFMERSVLFIPFTPFRHLGVGFYNHAEDLSCTWAASGFRAGQDQFGGSISTNGGWSTAERFTLCPYFDEAADGRYYLHLGAGHYFSSPAFDRHIFRTIPELYIGENAPGVIGTSGQPAPGAFDGTPFFVSTGILRAQYFNIVGTELLWVHGPFSLQSEAMVAMVDRIDAPNNVFAGFYTQAGFFLTGEHRPYDRKLGVIERIKPFENFFRVGTPRGTATGIGAWEVACRLSHIDLNSENVVGGRLTDITGGVNWYWNPYTKVVFNYVHAMTRDFRVPTANTDIFALRIQTDF